jgi:diguanylate cyclase (GGDEF)-like protein/PAS domain S-box-containing protein
MKEPRSIRVLLVEDEPGDAQLVRISLCPRDAARFDLTWTSTLGEARERLFAAEARFDVLLLDLTLPDSAGLDTVRDARRASGALPIIVLTGHDDADFALTALEAGADDYMVKGDFGHDGLVRAIRHALHRAEMEASNRLLATALNASPQGIVITDRKGRIEWANPAYGQMTGYEMEEIRGRGPGELVKSGAQDASFYETLWLTLLAGRNWRGELVNKRKDGVLYHEEMTIAPVRDEAGEIRHFIGIKQDISERKRLEAELKQLATTDPLTGLPNRRAFMERLEQELERLKRYDDSLASLLMLDLDHFKSINDTFGHAVGDETLRHFAALLRNELRKIDMPGRLGGEEFAILLPGTDRVAALALAERLRRRIAASPLARADGDIHFTVSIGGSALSDDDADPDSVLLRADVALYRAKNNGRDQAWWMYPDGRTRQAIFFVEQTR